LRPPRPRNSPISQARKEAWLTDFVGYRAAVNQGRLEAWLGQFAEPDRDLAARVLDCIEFFGTDRIAHAYRTCLAALPGWHANEEQRAGRWRFAPMSDSAGDSGGTMLHQFRIANGMSRKNSNHLFIQPASLLKEELGPEDTVVLVDDFIGTGDQVTTAWESSFSELVAGIGTVYLLVVAARRQGRECVSNVTDMAVHCAHEVTDADDFFGQACHQFTPEEKDAFKRYCKRANRTRPAGYGDCGLLVVFSHRCPSDSVAALHASHTRWRGLFPRND